MKLETKYKKWPLTKWKKEFDKVFSLYIRTRDNFTCFTCGKRGDRTNIDNGHFIPRGACGLELYFSEENCHAQCTNCNHKLEGNTLVYADKLGEEMVAKLRYIHDTRNSFIHWDKQDYARLIEKYESEIKKYEK